MTLYNKSDRLLIYCTQPLIKGDFFSEWATCHTKLVAKSNVGYVSLLTVETKKWLLGVTQIPYRVDVPKLQVGEIGDMLGNMSTNSIMPCHNNDYIFVQ